MIEEVLNVMGAVAVGSILVCFTINIFIMIFLLIKSVFFDK